jgi:hypothetical protein
MAAGCGRGAASVPPGPAAVQVSVTRDYGSTRLVSARAAPGQSALDALRRAAHVGTSYGGRFVESVNGLSGDRSASDDWLYFVNGIAPDVGAADMRLHPGDREWWDRRYWRDLVQTPVAIGSWPEPFVHGYDGHRHPVSVGGLGCASRIADALRTDGAQVTSATAPYRVTVETFAQAGQDVASDLSGRVIRRSLVEHSGLRRSGTRGSGGLRRGLCLRSPRLLAFLSHEIEPKRALGFEVVVRPTEQPNVGNRRRAALCNRDDVVELETVARATAMPVRAHERALIAVAAPHGTADLGGDGARVRRRARAWLPRSGRGGESAFLQMAHE